MWCRSTQASEVVRDRRHPLNRGRIVSPPVAPHPCMRDMNAGAQITVLRSCPLGSICDPQRWSQFGHNRPAGISPQFSDNRTLRSDKCPDTMPKAQRRAARENRLTPMQPRHFQPGEGNTFKIGRMSMTFKTTAAEDWSAYTVCEAIEPPQSGAGYHRHPTYDETFIICEGHYDFRLGEKLFEARHWRCCLHSTGHATWLCQHWP